MAVIYKVDSIGMNPVLCPNMKILREWLATLDDDAYVEIHTIVLNKELVTNTDD